MDVAAAGRTIAIAMTAACLAAADFGADERNRVANGSFEDRGPGGQPARWNVFVMPKEGAYGRVEPYGDAGQHAAVLHIPDPYASEPANNWSQSLYGDFAGNSWTLAGAIKTENATEAALWVQCWNRDPLRVVKSYTSSTEFPVYGDNDWEDVQINFTAPAETEFLVVRCVLKGEGTAWFDHIRLLPREEASSTSKKPKAGASKEADDGEDPPDDAKFPDESAESDEQPAGADSKAEAKTPKPVSNETENPDADPLADNAARDALVEANEALRGSIRSLAEQNAALLNQIRALQQELDALRQEVVAQQEAAKKQREADQSQASPEEPEYGPVLVPRRPQESETP